MQIGFIGLGKMGSRMVTKLVSDNHDIHVWNRSVETTNELVRRLPFIHGYEKLPELLEHVSKPRILWLMLPAGDATDQIISLMLPLLSSGDIVVDGGNSHYKDTERRSERLHERGIQFLGVGVSGGLVAASSGYPLMVGGDFDAYKQVEPILDSLAKPNGSYAYFGTGGAGHFIKMVHNGIEYGVMQAIAEGFDVLKHAPYTYDLRAVGKVWQKGSLVSGYILDRAVDALSNDAELKDVVGSINESGEARWTIEQAKTEGVSVAIIEKSLEYRIASQTDVSIQKSFTAKLIAAMRNAFGGHVFRKTEEG